MISLSTPFVIRYLVQWIPIFRVRSRWCDKARRPDIPILAWWHFAATLLLTISYIPLTIAATMVLPDGVVKLKHHIEIFKDTKVTYPDHAEFVRDFDQLQRATSMHAPFIVATGEIAQQIIGALDARTNTSDNGASLLTAAIPAWALYQVYGWFNETYSNIESVCEVDLDEIYFTEKGDKYVCEENSIKFPKSMASALRDRLFLEIVAP